MTGPGAPEDETTRRWREWSGAAGAEPEDLPGPRAAAPAAADLEQSAVRRFTAGTMGLLGSSLIAGLAVVVAVLTLPYGSGASPRTGSSLAPAGTTEALGEAPCVARTRNLLCDQQRSGFDNRNTLQSARISADGPGTRGSDGLSRMIDGSPETAWTSAGDITGATITVRFRNPATVGEIGLLGPATSSATTDPEAGRRHVLASTWSFAALGHTAGDPCADGGPGSRTQLTQSVDSGAAQRLPSGVTTCLIRIQIDRISSQGKGGFAGRQVDIGELLFRIP